METGTILAVLVVIRGLLRDRGWRYRDLSERVGVSEVTIKRWLTASDLSLLRLERIANALDLDLFALLALAHRGQERIFQLTEAQEMALVADPLANAVWDALRRGQPPDRIVAAYGLDPARWRKTVLRLEALGMAELHPADRIRLCHRGVHNLLPGGPLARAQRAGLLAWCADWFEDPGDGVATSSARAVGPGFVEEARGELRALAQRLRDRAYRDQLTVPLAKQVRVRWLFVLDEIPMFDAVKGRR